MKKNLLILILLMGCTPVRKLETLENALYEWNDVYVEIDENELYERLNISKKDFSDKITLKTLVVLDQKELFIFEDPSEYLKIQLQNLSDENTEYKENKSFSIYLTHKDPELIDFILKYLNDED